MTNNSPPAEYWHWLLSLQSLVRAPPRELPQIYGLHISKTPSNEDLNFVEKSKGDIETIKVKACGVLLSDLAKFVPDGIVVYFYALEGLQQFLREMDREDEKILKRIDSNKRVFFESAFEEQN